MKAEFENANQASTETDTLQEEVTSLVNQKHQSADLVQTKGVFGGLLDSIRK